MKVRFQADADFNHIIRRALLRLEPAVDFQTAHAADLHLIWLVTDAEAWHNRIRFLPL